MNTSQIAKNLGRVRSLLGSITKKIEGFRLLRFGGLLVNDDKLDHIPKSSYYPDSNLNLNDYTRQGYWDYDQTFWNIPPGLGGVVQVIHSKNTIIQVAISRSSYHISKRMSNDKGNTWSDWDTMVTLSSLPARKYQKGTISGGESVIQLTAFTIDAANPDSHMLFVDGVYMMESKPCLQNGDVIETGVTSYIKMSDTFPEDLPYKVYNSISVLY